ncbi:hypothetical protein EPO44_08700 [bacterium]|nr:MAG: hypothetical protein EPO44_08700 [bacterium]
MPLTVYNPTLTKPRHLLSIAPRAKPLEEQVWGFVDTSKVNADLFIHEIETEIQQSYRPRRFVVIRKESPGVPLTADQINHLAKECGFVVFCFGD